MRVICINNKKHEEDLTLYRIYEASESSEKFHYEIKNTDSDKRTRRFHSGRFKIIGVKEYVITRNNLLRLHQVACPKWKTKIEELAECYLGLFENFGVIPSIIVNEMFSAISNGNQVKVFNEVFPDYEKEETVFDMKGKGDFFAEGSIRLPHAPMMGVRHGGEHENKAFGLDKKFNWELVKDSYGVMCLIPTRKK